MAPRSELSAILHSFVENVYFQPPPKHLMKYPCIVYNRSGIKTNHADNSPYSQTRRYEVTVIDQDPDSPITDKVAMLPLCSYDRSFAVDNLNHDVFTLYF